jgi:glycosyltransferase involved in cell wall biosynthesis
MKIAVNTRLLIKDKLEGIGWFTFEVLKRITQRHPEHEFIFLFDRKYDDEFMFASNIKPVIVNPPARHAFLFYIWFEMMLPGVFKKTKADMFLSTDGYLSLNSSIPSLPVIHDLNFEHYPENIPYFARKHYHYFFPKYAQKATKIATVSEYTKHDIVNTYHVPKEKINVVYNGAHEGYKPLNKDRIEATRGKYSNGCPYYMYIGSLHPRKNIHRMMQAFDLFKQSSNSNIKLLIAGEKMWGKYDIENLYHSLHFKDDIVFLGRCAVEELHALLGSALSLVFVSYFEGFGIPALESMYSEVPVIASNVTSIPEICGDAALYADPYSVDSIKNAMIEMAGNHRLRNDLVQKSRTRSKLFSWDKTSQHMWNVVEDVLNTI